MAIPRVKFLDFTDPRGYRYAIIDMALLVPDTENPRIPPQANAREAIVALIGEHGDEIFELAKDILEQKGTSPSELTCVSPFEEKFIVKEGNRRYVAQRLLSQPQLLKGTPVEDQLVRWSKLSAQPNAKSLPKKLLVVIGDDHEAWIDRRHLGGQEGRGVIPWNTRQKRRRLERRLGRRDRVNAILEALSKLDIERFASAERLTRGFTTFERVVDSPVGRARIGIDVDENGAIIFTKGAQSLRYLEEILKDLRGAEKGEKPRLTSRNSNSVPQITAYLNTLDEVVAEDDSTPILVQGSPLEKSVKPSATNSRQHVIQRTVLQRMRAPLAPRSAKIFGEIKRAFSLDLPNAALILTRVLMELEADHFARVEMLAFAGDSDPEAVREVKEFRAAASRLGLSIPKRISDALKFAETKPLGLASKLESIIRHLAADGRYDQREASAKRRDIRSIVDDLNDAVHRLETVPDLRRSEHVLELLEPVYSRMTPK